VQTGANQTSVYYADGFKAAGDKVAEILGLPAAVGVIDPAQIKGGPQGAQVVVMVGKDLAASASSTSAGATATTKAGATATTKAGATATTKAAGPTTTKAAGPTTTKAAGPTTTKAPATTTTKKP
jgi:hypothetical protein